MLTKITDRVSQVRNSCRNTAEQIPGIWPRVPHGCAKKTSPKDFILVLALVLICKTYFVVRNLSRDRVNKQRLELVEFQKKKKKKSHCTESPWSSLGSLAQKGWLRSPPPRFVRQPGRVGDGQALWRPRIPVHGKAAPSERTLVTRCPSLRRRLEAARSPGRAERGSWRRRP